MTAYNWFMLWIDINAIVFTGVIANSGMAGLREVKQALIDRLKRGVYGR